ncbi:MAG: hypothetical protein R3B90_08285 [Planctomycetaceae bacterium]
MRGRKHRRYRSVVNNGFVNNIGISSALHDIGKVGVSDAVLLKPPADGQRTRDDSGTHTPGRRLHSPDRSPARALNFLQMAREIVLYHHERCGMGPDIPMVSPAKIFRLLPGSSRSLTSGSTHSV